MNTHNNLPKRQITSIEKYKENLEKFAVMSRGVESISLTLRDYERFFREFYIARYNTVKAEYELAQTYVDEESGREVHEWIELNFEEVINDMNRAGAKEGGRKDVSDQDLARILKDRRLVPEYDPLCRYFESLDKFDESELGHIDNLASYITVEGDETEQLRWKTNFKKSLVRTVKCALNPLYFNKHCLVLFSSAQSKGKTSFLRTLSPPDLSQYYYEEMIGTDKDSQIMIAKSFIILLDELATLSRMDINALKAVMSKREVNVRLPYEKRAQIFPRRCSFFATTNRCDFLVDKENVRWLVFDVKNIDLSYGNIFTGEYAFDINRVWAEAHYLYRTGFNCELSREDLAQNEVNNDLYMANNAEGDIINELFLPADSGDKDKKGYYRGQPTQIFEKAIEILLKSGRETAARALEKNVRMFYLELGRMKGWKKVSMKLVDGRTAVGYHYFVRSEIESDLFS